MLVINILIELVASLYKWLQIRHIRSSNKVIKQIKIDYYDNSLNISKLESAKYFLDSVKKKGYVNFIQKWNNERTLKVVHEYMDKMKNNER